MLEVRVDEISWKSGPDLDRAISSRSGKFLSIPLISPLPFAYATMQAIRHVSIFYLGESRAVYNTVILYTGL
jgi:hypothetical protein